MSYRLLVIQLPQFQPKFNEITTSAPLLLTWQPRAATCSKGCSLEVSDKKSWETYQIITVGIEFTVALFNSFYIYIYIYFVIMWWHLFTSDLCTFLLKSTSTCNTKAPPMLHPDPHPTPNSDVCPPNLSKFARSPRPSQDSNSLHRKTTIDRCWMMVTPDPCKPSSTTANINIRKNIYSTIVT